MTTDHPGAPTSMSDIRSVIDGIDDKIVDLLAQRLAAIRAAARIKSAPTDARVPWRVEQVVSRVRSRAAGAGFDPDVAERIWRAMMEECIGYEERVLSGRS